MCARRFVVGLATSPDGFKWTKRGPVFDGSREAGAHDELGAAACQVVSGARPGGGVLPPATPAASHGVGRASPPSPRRAPVPRAGPPAAAHLP